MKTIKRIAIGLLAIIGIVLIAALFVSREFNYEKTILIHSPIEKMWEHTNSLADIDS